MLIIVDNVQNMHSPAFVKRWDEDSAEALKSVDDVMISGEDQRKLNKKGSPKEYNGIAIMRIWCWYFALHFGIIQSLVCYLSHLHLSLHCQRELWTEKKDFDIRARKSCGSDFDGINDSGGRNSGLQYLMENFFQFNKQVAAIDDVSKQIGKILSDCLAKIGQKKLNWAIVYFHQDGRRSYIHVVHWCTQNRCPCSLLVKLPNYLSIFKLYWSTWDSYGAFPFKTKGILLVQKTWRYGGGNY